MKDHLHAFVSSLLMPDETIVEEDADGTKLEPPFSALSTSKGRRFEVRRTFHQTHGLPEHAVRELTWDGYGDRWIDAAGQVFLAEQAPLALVTTEATS